ncbi:MAG TPA: UDP-N-acetylmuramoyl-tripeptide--D-alanyl-D-alanine ligase [Methylomirabilota bacterium]|jgi:UDP-N-acetylmuramoyl-tripeptide--D-alanyl-D-alanine ligase|nr:UDP-N-acetylmuramoyl-tripeptide--D-alanyl-D-alanine ligase [Methylomirabilota bacterium]
MAQFSVQDLVRATEGALVNGDLAVPITGVSIDSRTLQVGEAFFAIVGHRLNGHAFLADAAARGAACVVVHALPDEPPANVPLVLVEDTTRALGRLAGWHRARFDVPVVAITGSIGKTTAKELTAAVLATRWEVLKPASSFNNQWGLPLTLLRLGPEHGVAVVELGTNQAGEIATLAAIARPTIGLVTMVAAVHTEFLGSIEGVRDEKAALVRALTAAGTAVLNADDPRVASMAREAKGRVVTFGRAAGATVRAADDARETEAGLAFTLEAGGQRQAVTIAFAGRHNVSNALAAAAVGVALDLPLADIARGLAAARPVGGRGVWKRAGEVTILDDTYNASPASVRAALDTLAAHRAGRRAVVVLGDMLELGAWSDEAHREIGRAVAALPADELVGFGRAAARTVEAARAAGLAEAHHAPTFEDTVAHLLKRLSPGDVVLIKGSRGMRMERVVDALVARLARADRSPE